MLSQVVQEALNEQVNTELVASYGYLAMATCLKQSNLHGFAKWMRAQSAEEYGHGMKLYSFMMARGCGVRLKEIPAPAMDFGTVRQVFEHALEQEISVSRKIDALYELAFKEKAFSALVELQWFITEQVEEESTFRGIVSRLKMIENEPSALLDMDREMGARQ